MDFSKYNDEAAANQALKGYSLYFRQNSSKFKDKPVTQRQCNDICCAVFFFIFFLSFVGYSAYSIRAMVQITQFNLIPDLNGTILQGLSMDGFKTFAIIMFSCLGGGIFVGFALCGVLCFFPEKGVMIMAFASVAPIIALALYFVILTGQAQKQFATFFFVVAAGCIGLVFAFQQALKRAAIIMKTVKKFILQNAKILILVGICLFYCLFVVCLWCLGFYSFCILYSQQALSYGGFVVSSIFWSFLLLFFNYYFYYTSVFLTTQSLSIWFYQKEQMDPISTPMRHMVRHIGTITFASLILSIITLLKILFAFSRCKKCQFCCCQYLGKCFSLLVCCCVGGFQVLAETLNSYAITICSLTGLSFFNSAKVMAHIASEDYQAFTSITSSSLMLRIGSIVLTSSIPTLVGAILIHTNLSNGYLTIVGSLLIMFTNSIIGLVILQVFIESVTSLFVMYRLDSQITQQGHEITWVEQYAKQLNKGFDQAFVDHNLKKPKPKYKKVTTVVVHANGGVQVFKSRVQVQPQQQTSIQGLN